MSNYLIILTVLVWLLGFGFSMYILHELDERPDFSIAFFLASMWFITIPLFLASMWFIIIPLGAILILKDKVTEWWVK